MWKGCAVAHEHDDKFGPRGGAVLGLTDSESKMPGAPTIKMVFTNNNMKHTVEGALTVYPDISP